MLPGISRVNARCLEWTMNAEYQASSSSIHINDGHSMPVFVTGVTLPCCCLLNLVGDLGEGKLGIAQMGTRDLVVDSPGSNRLSTIWTRNLYWEAYRFSCPEII